MLILEDLALASPRVPEGRTSWKAEITVCADAAIVVTSSRIAWAGPRSQLPDKYSASGLLSEKSAPQALVRLSLGGALVTPALVDCHTHMAFGGDRADEWRQRQNGVSYEEIAKQGGGISRTVSATRDLTTGEMSQIMRNRVQAWMRSGCGVIEVKSGYGLNFPSEENILRSVQMTAQTFPGVLRSTFLGAHTIPKEHQETRRAYLQSVCDEMMPAFAHAGLCQAVDAFCESIAFNAAEVEQVCLAAQKLGLGIHLHAEQLSWQGGAALAARYCALSADHLEYATDADAEAMAGAGVTAVMLPGSFLYLRESQKPPVASFRRFGVPMAVATDYNPGTSPLRSLTLAGSLATLLFGLTPEESFAGVTLAAARALGLGARYGAIHPGFQSQLAVWSAPRWESLFYEAGENFCTGMVFGEGEAQRLGPAFERSW